MIKIEPFHFVLNKFLPLGNQNYCSENHEKSKRSHKKQTLYLIMPILGCLTLINRFIFAAVCSVSSHFLMAYFMRWFCKFNKLHVDTIIVSIQQNINSTCSLFHRTSALRPGASCRIWFFSSLCRLGFFRLIFLPKISYYFCNCFCHHF